MSFKNVHENFGEAQARKEKANFPSYKKCWERITLLIILS